MDAEDRIAKSWQVRSTFELVIASPVDSFPHDLIPKMSTCKDFIPRHPEVGKNSIIAVESNIPRWFFDSVTISDL